MDDKREILEQLFPKAVLKAVTPEARSAIPAGMQVAGIVSIHGFPFRVGRESRVIMLNNKIHRIERATRGDTKVNNDMYLMDTGHRLQISREHFQIERTAEGYVLVDRGSHCGLTVDGKRIGNGAGAASVSLRDGAVIGIGTIETHYLFVFIADFDNAHW